MQSKLWFAAWEEVQIAEKGPYILQEPVLPELKSLLENLQDIKSEYAKVAGVKTDSSVYKEYFQAELQFPQKSWSTLPILVFGIIPKEAAHFPVLFSAIKREKNIIGCFFSKTGPYSSIKAHSGISNCMYRCHIGIEIPSSEADICGMRVGNDISAWHEGAFVYFDDSNYHESWNHSPSDRVIMIVDIIKEEYRTRWKFIQCRIIWSYLVLQLNEKLKFSWLKKLLCSQTHKPILDALAFLTFPMVSFMVFIKNEWTFKRMKQR